MLTIAVFLGGLAVGSVVTILVARNNRSKVERALLNADKVVDKYKDYMTKSDKY